MSIRSFVLGAFIGTALTCLVSQFHLVKSQDGFTVVRRARASMTDAYADVRDWGLIEWSQHRYLAEAMAIHDASD
jgi:hypothetical protein